MAKKNAEKLNGVAVIYARYSSHSQREVSIEQQVEECREYAQCAGISVVDVYSDAAISGKTDRRPAFQRMMRDAEKGKFQIVIAWKSNRIGRNMLNAMLNEAKFNDLGIRCLYVEEDFDDTAAGRFALRSMMNVNQFYSENMAEDIRRGLMDNAQRCMVNNGGLPLGYKKGEDGRYALDPPRDGVVREIYRRVADGEPFVDIANDLNARGIKTSRGGEWNRSSFHRLLTNERYRGVYIYGEVRVEGGVPRIIDDELFYRVQEAIHTKKNPQGRHRTNGDYLLTGKLYCGRCKAPMVGISGTSKSGALHYYYICKQTREHLCDKKANRRDELERAVAEAIRSYILQPEVMGWIADSAVDYSRRAEEDSDLHMLQDELAACQKSLKNMTAAIEAGIVTETTKSRLVELEREQVKLKARIAVERADLVPVSREHVLAWLEAFRSGDTGDKKLQAELFDTFLSAVYVYDGELKIVFGFGGGKNITTPITSENVDAVEDIAECSYSLPMCPPTGSQTNTAIYMVGCMFVLCCPFDPDK